MHILIKKSISHPSTPLPFLPGECVTVPDELASEWIAAEKAVLIPGIARRATSTPRRRERAARAS